MVVESTLGCLVVLGADAASATELTKAVVVFVLLWGFAGALGAFADTSSLAFLQRLRPRSASLALSAAMMFTAY